LTPPVLSLVLPARDVVQATPRTRNITVDLGDTPFVFSAGQAVFAGLADGTLRRPYSIACSPTRARDTNALELLVQIDDHAAPDPHLERAVPGTPLRIEGPFGSFGLPSPIPEPHVLFIAGGTGIAPLRSMMWETLDSGARVRIGLVYSARSPEEFAYRDELTRLASEGRIELQLTITRDGGTAWEGSRGRIDPALIQSMLKTDETRCVVCGPPALVTDATALLRAVGIVDSRIVSEAFVSRDATD
jgi:glycine betaine catabolism B